MHDKKKHINERLHPIQGLRPMSKSLPRGLKTILKKGGHNYSSIINNWANLVGKKIANVCYPKSIKTGKELKDGVLFLNVEHGEQLLIEYEKKNIIDKINSFFGYQFVKEVRLLLVREKINQKKIYDMEKNKVSKYHEKLNKIENSQLKKNLKNLIDVFSNKKY